MTSAGLRKPKADPTGRASDEDTRRFYEKCALEYARATRRRTPNARLEDFSARIPAGRILDLGCGAGYDLGSFASRGHTAIGLDYAEPLASIARDKSRSPVVVADMRTMPFQPGEFDGVWASASLLHLARTDLPLALEEIRRVLKPGGLLFASVKVGTGARRGDDGRSFTYYRDGNWREALASANFRSIEIAYNEGAPKRPDQTAERWLTSLATAP